MNYTEIKKEALTEATKLIQKVLDGIEDSVQFPFVSPDEASQIIEKLGAIDNEDFDSNGWDWDWWKEFTLGDKEYILGGSGYYGTTIQFCEKR